MRGGLLALHLHSRGKTMAGVARAIESRRLMRVLAVAKRMDQAAGENALGWRGIAQRFCEPGSNRRIVSTGTGKGLGRKAFAKVRRRRAAMRLNLGKNRKVVGGIDNDRDTCVVL